MYYKYPKTLHLPWSESISEDDIVSPSVEYFKNKEVVVTIKMDGENTSMYRNHIHARSLDSRSHPSRAWVKNYHSKIKHNIPEGWRICGENLYAKHSIQYHNLNSYFLVFSVWNEKNECLSWDDTILWTRLLDLSLVPLVYRGIYDEKKIKKLYKPRFEKNECEGYVVRLSDSFKYEDFSLSVGKYVRKSHIKTNEHWMNQTIQPNFLK